MMELTQNYDIGVIARIERDRTFADALLEEATGTLADQEYDVTQEILRVLVTGTVGYELLARSLSMTSEKLREILEAAAPPLPAQLSAITRALQHALDVTAS